MISLLYRAADALRRVRRHDAAGQGRSGEDLAHRYLRRHGCTIVARNHRPRAGGVELDIVAWDGGTLVFVEVKARASEEFGAPDRAVDLEKQGYLIRAARDYAHRAGVEWDRVRFDVVSIVMAQPPRIDWIRDAFART
jgi:putative endonuclease